MKYKYVVIESTESGVSKGLIFDSVDKLKEHLKSSPYTEDLVIDLEVKALFKTKLVSSITWEEVAEEPVVEETPKV